MLECKIDVFIGFAFSFNKLNEGKMYIEDI